MAGARTHAAAPTPPHMTNGPTRTTTAGPYARQLLGQFPRNRFASSGGERMAVGAYPVALESKDYPSAVGILKVRSVAGPFCVVPVSGSYPSMKTGGQWVRGGKARRLGGRSAGAISASRRQGVLPPSRSALIVLAVLCGVERRWTSCGAVCVGRAPFAFYPGVSPAAPVLQPRAAGRPTSDENTDDMSLTLSTASN